MKLGQPIDGRLGELPLTILSKSQCVGNLCSMTGRAREKPPVAPASKTRVLRREKVLPQSSQIQILHWSKHM